MAHRETHPARPRTPIHLVRSSISIPHNHQGPLFAIMWRFAIALACLIFTGLIVYLDREGYRDANGDGMSLLDSFYYATVSLSTTGYGDVTPMSDRARLLNLLLITPLRFIFLTVLVSTTVEVLTQRGREAFRESRWRKTVKDHVIVVGYGVKGRAAVTTLIKGGFPVQDIVVIEPEGSTDSELASLGVVEVKGDARREEVLRAAVVERAAKIIIAVDSDDTAVLVTIVSRRLNPTAQIIVAVREGIHMNTLRHTGADNVITTDESTGNMLASAVLSPHTGAVLSDIVDPSEGLEIHERKVVANEVGQPASALLKSGELVVTVIRNNVAHRFDENKDLLLESNDSVIAIRAVQSN